MALIKHPELKELSRTQITSHIETIRARRMVAAVTYHQGVNAKYQTLSDKLERRLRADYEMLGRELKKLDAAMMKVENRAAKIEMIRSEHGLAQSMVISIPDTEED